MTQDYQYNAIFDKCWQLLINYQGNKLEQFENDFKGKIVTQVYQDQELKTKINGMMYRNNIPLTTGIADDVIAEVVIHLMKMDFKTIFEAYCDSYRRVFALSVTIAVRCGFSKMNKEVHQNASVAKQILYKSNLNTLQWFCTNDEMLYNGEDKFWLPTEYEDDMWSKIRNNLDQEDLVFLDFLLDKVLNKKYTQSYSRDLRKNYYSFNEYRIRRLELQNKIKEIIKKGL